MVVNALKNFWDWFIVKESEVGDRPAWDVLENSEIFRQTSNYTDHHTEGIVGGAKPKRQARTFKLNVRSVFTES